MRDFSGKRKVAVRKALKVGKISFLGHMGEKEREDKVEDHCILRTRKSFNKIEIKKTDSLLDSAIYKKEVIKAKEPTRDKMFYLFEIKGSVRAIREYIEILQRNGFAVEALNRNKNLLSI